MFGIIKLLLVVVILVIATIFVYKIFYTHKINQRIQSEEITGKTLVDVSKMIMIAIITGLIIYAGILMYVIHDYATKEYSVSRNNYAVIDTSDASFAKVYSKEDNPGYKKEIVESGDYRFVVFTRIGEADDFHPDFLCFAEYIGTDKGEYECYSKTGFQSLEADGGYFYDECSRDIMEDLLYIGNLDRDCQFNISMSLLDKDAEIKYDEAVQQAYLEGEGGFPDAEEFAYKVGKVNISIE